MRGLTSKTKNANRNFYKKLKISVNVVMFDTFRRAYIYISHIFDKLPEERTQTPSKHLNLSWGNLYCVTLLFEIGQSIVCHFWFNFLFLVETLAFFFFCFGKITILVSRFGYLIFEYKISSTVPTLSPPPPGQEGGSMCRVP